MQRFPFSSLRFRLSLLLAVVVLPGLVLHVYTTLQHRERLAVVERQIDPEAASILHDENELARGVAFLSVFVLIAIGLGWGLGTRFLLRPVHSLLGATRLLAGGELSARASVFKAEGELAELAVSFNQMAESLQRRTREADATLKALQRSEQRYRSLVEASTSIVWNRSAQGMFEAAQPRWEAFTGQSTEELLGWGWLNAVHPDDRERVSAAWRQALRDLTVYQSEQRLRRWDGEYRYMMVRAVPILGDDGEPAEWIGVHSDITDRKLAEYEKATLLEREREARAEAEAANRSKSDFLAVISHELRTPLASIISYAELMETDGEKPLSAQRNAYLDRISASAWHLTGLVEQILEYTRLEAGRVGIHLAPVDVAQVVAAGVDGMKPLASAKGLRLNLLRPGQPTMIRTDQGKLRQIFDNLLSNAIKFTHEGEILVRVVVGDSDVRIAIKDSGPGIAPDHLGRIWNTFWQAENPLTRRASGTGLGLAIVRRLAQLLAGDVLVSSAVGSGSTFTVVLPRHTDRENWAASASESGPLRQAPAS